MPRKLDYIDLIRKQGARVLPPRPKLAVTPEPDPTPVTEISTEISTEASLDSAAARLQKQWHNPEPQPEPSKAQPTPEYAEYEGGLEPMLGDILDLVVVAFSQTDPTGRERGGAGLARIHRGPEIRGKKRKDGCYFRDCDVVSEGMETLRPGSRIRGRLAEAISSAHPFTVVDIEVYKN